MADNEKGATDQDGEFEDWLELYNNSDATVSLDGLYLSDDPTDLLVWEFPSGLTIAPGEYLIVWCDKDLTQTGLHADIKFSSGGESAILSYSDGTIIENVLFEAQDVDMSYSRIPNGTGSFVIKEPTHGFDNESSLAVNSFDKEMEIKYYPNPTSSVLNIENPEGNINTIKVVSMLGRVLFTNDYNNVESVQLDMSTYSKGTYFVTVNESKIIKILKD